MTTKPETTSDVQSRRIVSTRLLPAGRELVFKAFADPSILQQWWGPLGFTNTFSEFDFRPGGSWTYVMHAPDGTDYHNESRFLEVVKPERIVIEHLRPMHRFELSVSLQEVGKQTQLSWHMLFDTPQECERIKSFVTAANEQNFDRLQSELKRMSEATNEIGGQADREIVTTRDFLAPRQLVFDAWTDPAQLAKWWGPNGFSITTYSMDFRPGGVWKYVMHGPDGRDYQNRITYRQIQPPERLEYSHGGEGDDEDVAFETTVTFEQIGEKTRVVMRAVFATAAERDRVEREYGAVEGAQQTLARLAEVLSTR
jgi:uncharacterized protein YndB with AHSA1/START domain